MAILTFQIRKLPDLSLNKYQSLSDTGTDGVLNRHHSFLRQWHGICQESNTSIHLLYLFLPEADTGNRLSLYFMIQGEESQLRIVKPLLLKSPLSDFYEFSESQLPKIQFRAGATLVKTERLTEVYHPLTATVRQTHFVPEWEVDGSARLYDLFRMMETVGLSYGRGSSCGYRVDLYPASKVQETREKFTPVIKELQGDHEITLIKEDGRDGRDSYLQNISKVYEEWLSKVETSPHFQANIYGFAENTFLAKVLLNAAGAEALDEGEFSLAPIKPDANGSYSVESRLGCQAENYCFHPKQAVQPSWSTTYVLDEIEPFFRFPVLYDGENIELPKETAPAIFQNGIYIGEDEHGFPVRFPIEDLPRHAFFTGTPGSGKTNTMLHLVTELKKKQIPFLVLEPAKKEYRELLGNPLMQDVYLFSPHLQSRFPLRMNPFEFPKGVRLSEHINALLEVFQGSFVLEGATYKFLSTSIQKSYTDLGWDIEDVNGEVDFDFPSIRDVYHNLEKEVKNSTYDSEIKGNVQAFLQVRLGSLMERDAGELFDTSVSTLGPEEWLHSSAIVELEVLSEQTKNFFVLLVCHYILETLRVDPQGGRDAKGNLLPVRHAVFIEEAHNIIAPSAQQSGSDSIDPKISATAYIVKMLAEVRALREAIIIADQLPTALAVEVTKNTGLKLVHRMTAQDDREQIGSTISASPLQLEQMAAFSKGKALIYYEKTQKPYIVQVAMYQKPKIIYNFGNDRELYENVAERNTTKLAIAQALESWREKCVFPIYQDIMELQALYRETEFQDRKTLDFLTKECMQIRDTCQRLEKKCRKMAELWCLKKDGTVYSSMKEAEQFVKETAAYIQGLESVVLVIKER